ncbi:hypothetical protein HMSSN139_28790 [Paenibacillus sp. HMSSN-139]|nr:hypothetical protein HMSSN139_28790 [Paenibacillus sp. HMSSN-139]
MKKMFLLLIGCLMIFTSLSGCSSHDSNVKTPQVTPSNKSELDTVNIPQYDDFTKFMEDFKNNVVIEGFSLISPIKTIFLIEKRLYI